MMRVISRFHDAEGNCHYLRADEDSNEGLHDMFTSNGRLFVYTGDVNGAIDDFHGAGGDFIEGAQLESFNVFADRVGHVPAGHSTEPVEEEEIPVEEVNSENAENSEVQNQEEHDPEAVVEEADAGEENNAPNLQPIPNDNEEV